MTTPTAYPHTFPHPLVAEYGYSVAMGVLRTSMESGAPRQRRKYRNMPHTFNLSFVVPIHQIGQWQTWINSNAYDWFEIDLVTYQTTDPKACATPHYIRLISDLAFTALSVDYFKVTANAELSALSAGAPVTDYGQWIIGGAPASAYSAFCVGGTPAAPALNFTNPGTPASPAVVV